LLSSAAVTTIAHDSVDRIGELPIAFDCDGATLVGVLHLPSPSPDTGVVIVVGGPQYRVGSHRQFLLLARRLAAGGIAALRFDCRGMGDSDGEFPGFEAIDADIAAAVDALASRVPTITRFVLWGLCDAASAIAFYARRDKRVAGIVMLNPWVRSEATQARANIKHYYLQRLISPMFWRRVLRREIRPFESARSLAGDLVRATAAPAAEGGADATLAERMAIALAGYPGPALLVTSGRDLTAKEFEDAARGSRRWRDFFAGGRLARHELAEADHTFSRRVWRDQVADWTREWVVRAVKSPPDDGQKR
jgi:uncharacterized protein